MLKQPRKALRKFCGVGTAMYTPCDDGGGLNLAAVKPMVAFNLRHGIHTFFVNGSTGEGLLMTTEERKAMAAEVVQQVAGRATVMVHVGAVATREAVELAAHAEKAGADAVSSVPPFYYTVSPAAVREHYLAIARAVGVPMFIYHIPENAKHPLTPDLAAKCCEQPNVVGMKFSDNDMYLMRTIMDACGPDFIALTGNDQMMLSGLVVGSHGAVGRNQNLMPGLFVKTYEAYMAGDIRKAERTFAQLLGFYGILRKYGTPRVGKAVLRMLGLPVGRPRMPLEEVSADEEARLKAELTANGFFRVCG
jgi:N-acetylneuraminate lyase